MNVYLKEIEMRALCKFSLFGLLLTSALIFSSRSLAESADVNDTIKSGRPGAAIGADVVSPQRFQIETGYQLLTLENPAIKQSSQITELRYGVLPDLELTSEFDFQQRREEDERSHHSISDIEIGLKAALFKSEEELRQPSIYVRARLQLPGGEDEFTLKNPAPNLILASEIPLPDKFSLEADVGIRSNLDEGSSQGFYALSLARQFADNVSLFVEGFA
ncbi:MAG: transporter [Proteobacteria bacterium]|nr:MAG: transporter [Pseudomonadota bacterium]